MSRALVFCLSLALSLVAAEAAFRRALPQAPLIEGRAPIGRSDRLVFEGSIFSRHVLPTESYVVDGYAGAEYRINAQGYRGGDFAWAKPPGTLRVVVYGGSAVFDIFATEGEDWPSRLEAALPGEVEVINAGIPGHASFDSLGRFLAEGHRLQPDIVVLYHGWNDLRTWTAEAPLLRHFRPYAPERDPVRAPAGRLDRALARASHLYRFARLRFLVWNQDLGLEGRRPRGDHGSRIARSQVEQFRLTVATFVDLVRNAGALPVLVSQARLVAPGNSDAEKARVDWARLHLDHAQLVAAYATLDGVLAEVAFDKRVPLVDASARLSGRGELFRDGVHTSPEGSARLAEVVGAGLAPLLAGPVDLDRGRVGDLGPLVRQ